jgi:hypothetical protein
MSRQISRLTVAPTIQHRPIWANAWIRDIGIGTGIFIVILTLFQLG